MNGDTELGKTRRATISEKTTTKLVRVLKAVEWPSKLGWTVNTRHGQAEVRDLVSQLKCFVPMGTRTSRRRPSRTNPLGIVHFYKYRVMFFPLGTDPVEAVQRTMIEGESCEN